MDMASKPMTTAYSDIRERRKGGGGGLLKVRRHLPWRKPVMARAQEGLPTSSLSYG